MIYYSQYSPFERYTKGNTVLPKPIISYVWTIIELGSLNKKSGVWIRAWMNTNERKKNHKYLVNKSFPIMWWFLWGRHFALVGSYRPSNIRFHQNSPFYLFLKIKFSRDSASIFPENGKFSIEIDQFCSKSVFFLFLYGEFRGFSAQNLLFLPKITTEF